MDKIEYEQIRDERIELDLMVTKTEQIVSKLKENVNYIEAQKEIKRAEEEAMLILRHQFNSNLISMRLFRPNDIENFTAGIGGTSKTMGENDITVATGTTENTLYTTLQLNKIFIISGIYLPKCDNIHTDYVSMYIGNAKQRWYRGSEIECIDRLGFSFRDPLLVRPGETVKIKFLTTSDGYGTGKANNKHQINILGKVFKLHKTIQQEDVEIAKACDEIIYKSDSIIDKVKRLLIN